MQLKPKLSLNFWDDFYDDGFVPNGQTQKTYAYIEESPLTLEQEAFFIAWLKLKLTPLLPTTQLSISFFDSTKKYPTLTEGHFKRWELILENITHKELESLIETISTSLLHPEFDLVIYSES